jgi:hypothetical protein
MVTASSIGPMIVAVVVIISIVMMIILVVVTIVLMPLGRACFVMIVVPLRWVGHGGGASKQGNHQSSGQYMLHFNLQFTPAL